MAPEIVTPSHPPIEPARCNQEVSASGSDSASICGALADVVCEDGPRCKGCFLEFGGQVVAEIAEDIRPVRVIWRMGSVAAARELDARKLGGVQ